MADRNTYAVVLVHGIGDLEAGDVLDSAAENLSTGLGGAPLSQRRKEERDGVTSTVAELDWQGTVIRLVEFHWAGAIGKIRLTRPLDALRKALEVVGQIPLLGAIASKPW